MNVAFSALTLLVGCQEGYPTCKKIKWWGAGVVICLERGADLHMAQLMPLPLTVSCFSKIHTGFTFLVPAHLGTPGQRAIKRCVLLLLLLLCLSVARRDLFLLNVELFDDDADEEVECEERAEHDEQHEVEIHVRLVLLFRLLMQLQPPTHIPINIYP